MSERGGDFIKHDISSLSGKKDVLPKFVGDRVVLGSDNEGIYRRQISGLVRGIEEGRILEPINPDRSSQTSTLLKNFFNVATLQDLRDGQRDANKPEYVRDNLKKSEDRLAKAILISLKKSGVEETDLVSPDKINEKLPEELRGLGEKVVSFVITDSKIKDALATVDLYRNLKIDDYDEKKDLLLGQIEIALKDIRKSISKGNVAQVELATNYLNSLQKEILRNRENETITDEIISFLDDYVIRKDVTVDKDLNLGSADGGNDFEKVPGVYTPDDYANFRDYRKPETVRWLRDRENKASELITICSGGAFSSIDQIDEKLEEGGILSPYYTNDEDGSRGDKEYLLGLKDTLGFCVYEAIQASDIEANKTILGTLHTKRVDRLIPMAMEGLGDDIVVNTARDPFLREQLKTICLLDKDKQFSLMAINGGFSDIDTKRELQRSINSIITKILGDKRMGSDKGYTSEARRIHQWLLDRNNVYQALIARQEKMGRYGEIIPEEPKERYEMARTLLDTIEASGSAPGSLNIMDQCTKLFNMTQSEKVEEDIKKEIRARLSLAFMYYHMHAAGGLLNNRGQSIEDAHEQGFKEGLLINKEAMEFFLKLGANGLPVAECWDAIEDLNFGWEDKKKTKNNDSYFRLLSKTVGIDPNLIIFRNDRGEIDREGKLRWGESDWAIKPLSVDNPEGHFLLSMKENGLKFLGIKGDLSDEDYLKKWDEVVNPDYKENNTVVRYTYRQKFVGDFHSLQNSDSVFWGKGSENAMRYNYFTDINLGRKAMVKDYILSEIKKKRIKENEGRPDSDKLPIDKKTLEKGFELAEKLQEATAETSVFNPCFAGHNDFSELILTEANTKDRQKKLKTIGARVAMSEIVSFYTTWPRYIAGGTDNDRRSVFKPLYTKDIKTERMDDPKNDSYFLMTAILPKKILPVQSFFMKEDISSKDVLSVETWKKLYDPIAKVIGYSQDVLVDPTNEKTTIKVTKENKSTLSERMRLLAVKAVLQMAVRPTTGWDWGNITMLGDLVTEPYTIVEAEDKPGAKNIKESFIKKGDWDELFNSPSLSQDMRQRFEVLKAAEKAKSTEKYPFSK